MHQTERQSNVDYWSSIQGELRLNFLTFELVQLKNLSVLLWRSNASETVHGAWLLNPPQQSKENKILLRRLKNITLVERTLITALLRLLFSITGF